MAIIIGFFAAQTYNGTSFARVRGSRPLTMDHVFNGTFFAARQEIRWVPEGELLDLTIHPQTHSDSSSW